MSTEFIIMEKIAHARDQHKKYVRVAVCEVTAGVVPHTITPTARGMVRIVWKSEPVFAGTTERCGAHAARVHARKLLDNLNASNRSD